MSAIEQSLISQGDPIERTRNLMAALRSLPSFPSQGTVNWIPTENQHHPRYRSLSRISHGPQVDLICKVAALEVIERLLQRCESTPDAELSYEFNVSRLGDNYIGGRDVAEPIDVSRIDGCTGYVLRILGYVEATIKWPTRLSGYKASFTITN